MEQNNLKVFSHENFSARTIEDENGEIWIVANDVLQSLGYSETSNASRLFQSVPDIWNGGLGNGFTPLAENKKCCV